MRVIFLQDIPRVGKKHDVKEVNSGYAMNFLIPRKFAVLATPDTIKALELRKKEILVEREIQDDLLLKNLEELKSKVLTIKAKADEKGHLFSGIHAKEIVEAMQKEHGATITEEFITLEKPIKAVGEFDIPIEVKGKKSSFKLVVKN